MPLTDFISQQKQQRTVFHCADCKLDWTDFADAKRHVAREHTPLCRKDAGGYTFYWFTDVDLYNDYHGGNDAMGKPVHRPEWKGAGWYHFHGLGHVSGLITEQVRQIEALNLKIVSMAALSDYGEPDLATAIPRGVGRHTSSHATKARHDAG